jgi:hypothetical protein
VQILGPGTPPDQISVHPVQDGFSIHWLPPQIPNGDVIGYAVYWSRDPDAELADWVIKQSNGMDWENIQLFQINHQNAVSIFLS